jgi:iron complex outermembrane receptor protein
MTGTFSFVRVWGIAFLAIIPLTLTGQDSTRVLPEIEIQGYRYSRSLLSVPVSAGVITESDLLRFNNTSILPAVNTIPGVRMEERSPGSYRFSVRGSLVRSPFGVRNVKVYWNNLPFTDGAGNTYLNLIDLSTLGGLEIIKGPGGSLYGAGTGGVLLLKSRIPSQSAVQFSTMFGSYGLQRHQLRGDFAGKRSRGALTYARQQSNGYREQTSMNRDAVNGEWIVNLASRTFLSTTVLVTDVYYQTPGGLTSAEFNEDPRQARPDAGPNQGAVEQEAAVRNKSVFGGITLDHDWSDKLSARLGVFTSYNDFENYSIRNVENRYETNFGERLEIQYAFGNQKLGGKIIIGEEMQGFLSPFHVSENNTGQRGDRTFTDDLKSYQSLVFAQTEFYLPYSFFITAGASINWLKYSFERSYPEADLRKRRFPTVFSPRLALLKKVTDQLSAYGSVSKGFSPPSLAEVRPSTEVYNGDLEAEDGINYEMGIRGAVKNIRFDVTLYDFNLKNTIVLQRVADGAEYFVNAGSTDQKGIEITFSIEPVPNIKIWSSINYNHYRFDNYIKDNVDYSGNKLTGVPPSIANVGADVDFHMGWYINVTGTYTDQIPLNDANTEFADDYILANVRAGRRFNVAKSLKLEVFAGVNNLLDQRYSLGNDLNAFGGRYFNVAPAINFFGGLRVDNVFQKSE